MIVNIRDLRRVARRRLPRFLFDYIDGGAYDEKTLRWNETAFDRWRFVHRALADVSQRSLGTTLLGAEIKLPFMLGPTGFAGLFAPRGEVQAARAAEAAGIPFCLSTASIASIEEIRAATAAPFWFQLYLTKDRGITRSLLERAAAAGCPVLAFTVDVPMRTLRERDVRNRFATRSSIGIANWIGDIGVDVKFEKKAAAAEEAEEEEDDDSVEEFDEDDEDLEGDDDEDDDEEEETTEEDV